LLAKEALLGEYASLTPDTFSALDGAGSHVVYEIRWAEAGFALVQSLEVGWDVISVREMECLPP
jgi:hypothetical protein